MSKTRPKTPIEIQELIRHLREDWQFSYEAIAGYLNEKGIPTLRGKQWTSSNVHGLYQYWYEHNEYRHYYTSENLRPSIGKVFSWAMYPVQSIPDENSRRN